MQTLNLPVMAARLLGQVLNAKLAMGNV